MMADARRSNGFDRVRSVAQMALRKAARVVGPAPSSATTGSSSNRTESAELAAMGKTLREIRDELRRHRRFLETIQIQQTSSTMQEVQAAINPLQLDALETMDSLAETGRSFARFGDGEFRLALRPGFNLGFQTNSPGLRGELRALLASTSTDELLVGFPHLFRDAHWSGVWADVWPELRELVPADAAYGNSHVTRPHFFSSFGESGVEAWRRLWDGRNVCVIAGHDSRFELVPALFDGVLSVQSIDAPSTQAYGAIDDLEARALESNADVFLIALGPAGTLLAARLASAGRQALDIGHLSASYRSVFKGTARPEALKRSSAKKGNVS